MSTNERVARAIFACIGPHDCEYIDMGWSTIPWLRAARAAVDSLFIPVTEDLPDNEERVWIFRKGQSEPEKGCQSGVDWLSVETGFPIIVHDVTHWMPMLTPETKEKDKT